MPRLLLVRHGITEFNSARRFAGYSDMELSAEGYEQVEKLRDRLAGDNIDAAYSSDLKRAMATADIISSRHNVDIVPCSELREVNYGDAEGLTFQEISNRFPEVAKLIVNFNLNLKFPNGESFKEFIERTNKFLDRLKKHEPSETILIVSHSGPLRVLICTLLDIDLEHWWQFQCDNAAFSIMETSPRGSRIRLLNDISHLSAAG